MRRSIKFAIIIFLLFSASSSFGIDINQFANKVAFLKKGDVWISDKDGRVTSQITKTNGKVESFIFSPTLKYLAYSRGYGYVDGPGLWENEQAPKGRYDRL